MDTHMSSLMRILSKGKLRSQQNSNEYQCKLSYIYSITDAKLLLANFITIIFPFHRPCDKAVFKCMCVHLCKINSLHAKPYLF